MSAPLIRGFGGGEPERGCSLGGDDDMGVDDEAGVDTSLTMLEPLVATTDGELGGSGDRVKYTTLASEPPICSQDMFSTRHGACVLDNKYSRPPQCATLVPHNWADIYLCCLVS